MLSDHILDLVIVALVAASLASGWRRGLTWVALSLFGLFAGLVVGAAVAPPLARHLSQHNPETQSLLGTAVFLMVVAIVQGIGTAIGYRVRVATLRSGLAELDSIFGSVLAALGVLVSAWYLGLAFSRSQFTALDRQIQSSTVLRALDSVAPRPPAFLASIEKLLSGQAFPNPFAGLAPDSLPALPIPESVDTAGVQQAAHEVSKVLSEGGCGLEAGSSWPIGNDYVITNAHVVAGGHNIAVQPPGRSALSATVVLFDPEVDVAVLLVRGLDLPALPRLSEDPASGTPGAAIGYPGGGAEKTVPAAVRGVENAQGRDIYGNQLVTRRIEVLAASIIPGNSGGPVVDTQGRVMGLVFAASTTDDQEGYALTMGQVEGDITAAMGRTSAVDTQDCTS